MLKMLKDLTGYGINFIQYVGARFKHDNEQRLSRIEIHVIAGKSWFSVKCECFSECLVISASLIEDLDNHGGRLRRDVYVHAARGNVSVLKNILSEASSSPCLVHA